VTWSERIAELRAAMAAREAKGLPPRVSVTCSGCDQTAVIERPNVDDMDAMFPGWLLDDEPPYHDYCPDCRASAVPLPRRARRRRTRRRG
jgi:hypothetical protein